MTMTSYPGVAMISYSQHVHVNMGFFFTQYVHQGDLATLCCYATTYDCKMILIKSVFVDKIHHIMTQCEIL